MVEISEVSGITGSTLELFKEAGLVTAESLAERSVVQILEELDAANRSNVIPVRLPSGALVLDWKNAARTLVRESGTVEARPSATEVQRDALEEAGIDFSAVPMAKVVESETREDPPGEGREPASSSKRAKADPATRKVAEREGNPSSPAPAKKKRAGAGRSSGPPSPADREQAAGMESEKTGAAPVRRRRQQKKSKQRTKPVVAPSESTTRFRQLEAVQKAKPQGERRNRGMSHPDAARVRLAALVTVMGLTASILTTLALFGALVMVRFYKWEFHWTISLLLLVYPVVLFLYLGIGTKARCRLCGQRLLVPRNCRKHERARKSIFGYTLAVALDALFLASYRCMLCGTKTRLRD